MTLNVLKLNLNHFLRQLIDPGLHWGYTRW